MTTKIKLNQVYPIPASASDSELTGTPTAPTPSTSDDSNKIATTEYVKDNLDNYLPLSGGSMSGRLTFNLNSSFNAPLHFNNVTYSGSQTYNQCAITAYAGQETDTVGQVVFTNWNTGKRTTYIRAHDSTGYSEITVSRNNGVNSATAPTPATTDNSTQIATTAYVKDCVPKSIGSVGTPVYSNANGVITACTVTNNVAVGTLGWNGATDNGLNLINANTLAYWNGTYSGTTSNLAYCNKGAFGDMATKTASNYVATSGNQTIAGNKTFSGTSTFSGQVILTKNTDGAGTAANAVPLIVGGAQTAKHLELDSDELMAKSNGTTASALYINNDGGAVYIGNSGKGVCVNSSNSIYPRTTKAISCGHSSYLWTTVYAQTTTISTSDERQKQQIQDIPDEVLDAWEEVEFKQYKLNDSVTEKGDEKARLHIGLIAQEIKATFEKHGLDPTKYGLFCHDEWDVHEDPEDETSPIIRHEDSYALRYEEALCLEAACERRFRKRVMAILNKQSN